MKTTMSEVSIMIAIVVIVIVILFQPYAEMKAFNKFSMTKATYWDALWSDLRIIPNGGVK